MVQSVNPGSWLAFEVVGLVGHTAWDSTEQFRVPFYYRILTAAQQIKYLGIEGTKPNSLDVHSDELGFDTVPEGSWTIGTLTLDQATQKLALRSTAEARLPSIETIWSNIIDLSSVGDPIYTDQDLLCYGKRGASIYSSSLGPARTMVHAEWSPARFDSVDIITGIYSRIEGHGIGPKFLAHVTEGHNRVIGYMVEGISGRPATFGDLEACREVLARLHGLGIVYGSLTPESFLVTDDGVLLHLFACSRTAKGPVDLRVEMAGLEGALNTRKERLRPLTEDLSRELLAIQSRDGGLHPLLTLYAQKNGKLMEVTKEEHQEMLQTLWVDGPNRFLIPPEWR